MELDSTTVQCSAQLLQGRLLGKAEGSRVDPELRVVMQLEVLQLVEMRTDAEEWLHAQAAELILRETQLRNGREGAFLNGILERLETSRCVHALTELHPVEHYHGTACPSVKERIDRAIGSKRERKYGDVLEHVRSHQRRRERFAVLAAERPTDLYSGLPAHTLVKQLLAAPLAKALAFGNLVSANWAYG